MPLQALPSSSVSYHENSYGLIPVGGPEVFRCFFRNAEVGRYKFIRVAGVQRSWLGTVRQHVLVLLALASFFQHLLANECPIYYQRYSNEDRYHTGDPNTTKYLCRIR